MISDEDGSVVWSDEATPFGEASGELGDERFALKYTGKSRDEETGLFYFNARWYDSSIGRFVSEDPIKDGVNWYVYCLNNPLVFYDKFGLSSKSITRKFELWVRKNIVNPVMKPAIQTTFSTLRAGVKGVDVIEDVSYSITSSITDAGFAIEGMIEDIGVTAGMGAGQLIPGPADEAALIVADQTHDLAMKYADTFVDTIQDGLHELNDQITQKGIDALDVAELYTLGFLNYKMGDPAELRNKLFQSGDRGFAGAAAHHIVPGAFVAFGRGAWSTLGRGILEYHNIDLNSVENGVWLPHSKADPKNGYYHRKVHTEPILRSIALRLLMSHNDSGKQGILDTLDEIKFEFKNNDFEYINAEDVE